MSEPKTDYRCPSHGAQHELISAMSALNMEPAPISNPPDGALYLSETDAMAKHAMEHMNAAFQMLQKCNELYEAVSNLQLWGLDDSEWTEALGRESSHDELVSFLRTEANNAREKMKASRADG